MLIEAEDHLREAVRDHTAAGMSEADAERLAIERFGSARDIAERFGAGDVARAAVWGRMGQDTGRGRGRGGKRF